MNARIYPIVVATWLTLAVGACGKSGPHSLHVDGMLGQVVQGGTFSGVLTVATTVNGTAGPPVLVDTGAPITVLAPTAYVGAAIASGEGVVSRVNFSGVTLENVPVFGAELFSAALLGGLIGGDVVCQFATTFNYRDRAVVLDATADPPGVESPGVTVPFSIEGGGPATVSAGVTVMLEATRIVLDASIEGQTHTVMIDTGADFVTLRSAVFASIAADGRATLPTGATEATGQVTGTVTRVHAMSIGTQSVSNVAVQQLGDTLLDNISTETGHTIDGLIGENYLREFLSTVDYPGSQLRLQRYATRAHIVDEFERVGFWLAISPSGGYTVSMVAAGTDATTQGVIVGESVVSVDGQAVSSLGLDAADTTLRGTVGTTHSVAFATRTLTLQVQELLPLM